MRAVVAVAVVASFAEARSADSRAAVHNRRGASMEAAGIPAEERPIRGAEALYRASFPMDRRGRDHHMVRARTGCCNRRSAPASAGA